MYWRRSYHEVHHLEGEPALGDLDEQRQRTRVAQEAVGLAGRLEEQRLHLGDVHVQREAEDVAAHEGPLAPREVRHQPLRHRLVGDGHELLADGEQPRRAPGDLEDLTAEALTARVDLHPVTQAEGAIQLEGDAGEELSQRVLQRQAQDHRHDRGRRE